jgi:tetratricopeptide (TPR) repeat protein
MRAAIVSGEFVMIRKLLVLLCLFLPTAASAEWYEARSNNFIVYSEGSRADAEAYAVKLERYHFVLRTFHRISAERVSNPLRVFLFSSFGSVREMAGGASVAGYYVSDASGLMFVGSRARGGLSTGDPRSANRALRLDAESTLLHEYAHHFMFQYFPATYPIWYVEGFAEFWGTTRLLENDVVEVGFPAEDRVATFDYLTWMPLQRLLTIHNYGEAPGENIALLYAQGWLLMRYAFDHPERKRQVDNYLRLINGGRSYEEAMREAFPDIERFDRELFDHAGARRFTAVRLPFRTIIVGEIAVRELRPAENALIEHQIKLGQGYPQREAAEFAREVRSIASRYPDDPVALAVLMEAERLAGNHDAAIAASDRLLQIEPNHARAMASRGLAQAAKLRAASSTDRAEWSSLQQLLARAARAAPNDPVVLAAYYDGYAQQGVLPPYEAQNALYTAMERAPSDGELRYRLARDFEQRNMIPEAIAIIRPEALAMPHNESERDRRRRERDEERYREAGTERHETAREMLARLEQRLAQGGTQAAQVQPSQPQR